MWRSPVLVAVAVVAGAAFSISVVFQRGGDVDALPRDEAATRIDDAAVERKIREAPEPVKAGEGGPVQRVRCVSAGSRRWRCVTRYASGTVITYEVRVAADGSFVGRESGNGPRSVTGSF